MTKYFLSLILSLSSVTALASELPAHVEICSMELENGEALCSAETIFDIKENRKVSKANFDLIQRYYLYTEGKNYSLSQLQVMFADGGEEQFNDLYLIKYVFKKTGNVYFEVRTYPGDNAVGIVFEGRSKEVVANNGDGSYEISVAEEDLLSCYEYNEGK